MLVKVKVRIGNLMFKQIKIYEKIVLKNMRKK